LKRDNIHEGGESAAENYLDPVKKDIKNTN
jgi:hypothetical protein